MWSGFYVCDSHEGRVRFEADLGPSSQERVQYWRGNDVRAFSSWTIGIWCAVGLKELANLVVGTATKHFCGVNTLQLKFCSDTLWAQADNSSMGRATCTRVTEQIHCAVLTQEIFNQHIAAKCTVNKKSWPILSGVLILVSRNHLALFRTMWQHGKPR